MLYSFDLEKVDTIIILKVGCHCAPPSTQIERVMREKQMQTRSMAEIKFSESS